MHSLGEIIIMDIMTVFKNKKAFSLVELVIAMIIASIVMLSVYFMLIIAYDQFNDLTEASENFNNLQVFERMFQRSAMSCSYYELNGKTFKFLIPKDNGKYKTETYKFNISNNDDFKDISIEQSKYRFYSGNINDNFFNIDKNNNYKVLYKEQDNFTFSYTPAGYNNKFTPAIEGNVDTTLFDNIVKVYYEISSNTITTSNFYKLTGTDLKNKWGKTNQSIGYKIIYVPFIKLIIVYKDNKNRLRKFYITCRLRGIEGTEFNEP